MQHRIPLHEVDSGEGEPWFRTLVEGAREVCHIMKATVTYLYIQSIQSRCHFIG